MHTFLFLFDRLRLFVALAQKIIHERILDRDFMAVVRVNQHRDRANIDRRQCGGLDFGRGFRHVLALF